MIYHRILNTMIAYEMQRKRLLNLLLTVDQEEFLKKSQIVNHVSTGFDLDVKIAGGWDSIRIELHHLNRKKIFA